MLRSTARAAHRTCRVERPRRNPRAAWNASQSPEEGLSAYPEPESPLVGVWTLVTSRRQLRDALALGCTDLFRALKKASVRTWSQSVL